jgi:hypothetical protein
MQTKLLGTTNAAFNLIGQRLIRFLYPSDTGEKVGVQWHSIYRFYRFIDFKKAYDSVRREALYNILVEFGIPRKIVGIIKMC